MLEPLGRRDLGCLEVPEQPSRGEWCLSRGQREKEALCGGQVLNHFTSSRRRSGVQVERREKPSERGGLRVSKEKLNLPLGLI